MPAVVIFEFGQKPQTVILDGSEWLIGRSENADICLPNETVSRSHATIVEEHGRFKVVPMNVGNTTVVNGKTIDGPTKLPEGAELLLGPYLLLFTRAAKPPASFVGKQPFRFEMRCQDCHWQGLLSGHKGGQRCPQCGSTTFVNVDDAARSEQARVQAGPTSYVSVDEMKKLADQLKAAKRTKVVRMSKVLGLPASAFLEEDAPTVFGKPDQSNMPVQVSFRWGKPPEIRWMQGRYVLDAPGWLPGVKVNGVKTKRAAVKDGDTIEVGGHFFSISTE
jgi:rubredoxin